MPLRVSNLRLDVAVDEAELPARVAKALRVGPEEIGALRILRKSLDARDSHRLLFDYSVEVALRADEAAVLHRTAAQAGRVRVEPYVDVPWLMPPSGTTPLTERPLIVGSGPAGLAAAWFLAEYGYRPLVVERGQPVRQRIADVRALEAGGPLNPESNYLFGEGGAGTFSDGKLTCRLGGPDVQRILQWFASSKGKPSVVYDQRPHLGSNRLPAVVKSLRRQIEARGGEFLYACRMEDLLFRDGRVIGAQTSSGRLLAGVVILATGHSARDTYEMLLARGAPLERKPFQFGFRIEQPQEAVNRAQYGQMRWEQYLGAADYSVVVRGPHDVFSFCMCAGGQVIPSVSEPGHFATNGMSLSKRVSPFANSGLMVTLQPEEFPAGDVLAGMRWQRQFESRAFALGRGEYLCPIQRAEDFLAQRPTRGRPASSCERGVVPAELAELGPPQLVNSLRAALPALDRRWHGRFLREATLVGPESRGSAPVRVVRDRASFECPGLAGLYPIGEGAGYAGGIVSAAVDGLRAARAIITRYAPLEARR